MRINPKRETERIHNAYAGALSFISRLLESSGTTSVLLRWADGERAAYNVCDHNGESDRIDVIEMDGDYGLTAIGQSGTEYPLGDDIDGQDNYTIAGLDVLLQKTAGEVSRVLRGLVQLGGKSVQARAGAIRDWLGEDGSFDFREDSDPPSFRDGETVLRVTPKTLETTNGHDTFRHLLESLTIAELTRLANAINERVIARYGDGRAS